MITIETICDRLRVARQLKRLTQPQLGEILGVSQATISSRENTGRMTLCEYLAHCKALGQSPSTMLADYTPWEVGE